MRSETSSRTYTKSSCFWFETNYPLKIGDLQPKTSINFSVSPQDVLRLLRQNLLCNYESERWENCGGSNESTVGRHSRVNWWETLNLVHFRVSILHPGSSHWSSDFIVFHRAAVPLSITTSYRICWFVIPGCVESFDRISAWGSSHFTDSTLPPPPPPPPPVSQTHTHTPKAFSQCCYSLACSITGH